MKRKPSNEQFTSECQHKQILRKNKSPNSKKVKQSADSELLSFLGVQKNKIIKQKQQLSKHESKGQGKNSSNTGPKQYKPNKKMREKSNELTKKDSKIIGENEIMNIIINFAIKIQRQWRAHIFRKRFNQMMKTIREDKLKLDIINKKANKNSTSKLHFDENKIRHLHFLQDSKDNTSSYDIQKYKNKVNPQPEKEDYSNGEVLIQPLSYRSLRGSNHERHKRQADARKRLDRHLNSQNHQSTQEIKSKDQMLQETVKFTKDHFHEKSSGFHIDSVNMNEKDRRVSLDNQNPSQKLMNQNRRHSAGQLLVSSQKRQIKLFHIDKAFQIKIGKPIEHNKQSNQFSIKRSVIKGPSPRYNDNDKNAFNIKFPFQNIFSKLRKETEGKKLKRLLSIQNGYNCNQMTLRTYQQTINQVNLQHKNKLELFKEIKSNLLSIFGITKNTSEMNRFAEDGQNPNSVSNFDFSMSFDKWDFNSSVKKSLLDNHLDVSEQYNNKVISIQSVLQELDDDENNEAEDRKFKKFKSIHIIDAIAERSKEIDEESFRSSSPHSRLIQAKQQEQQIKIYVSQQQISIQQVPIFVKQQKSQDNPFQCKKEQRQNSLMLSTPKIEPLNEYTEEKVQNQQIIQNTYQSPPFNRIDASSPINNIHSEISIFNSTDDKNLLKELLTKDFRITSSNITPKQSEKPTEHVLHPLIMHFIEIVNERALLNNIKIINSVKFMFAKMAEQKKKSKLSSKKINAIDILPFETDINAINTWLLQISHFMLDNFQEDIRKNLIFIKQPPALELLNHAKKHCQFFKVYETIPEYVFKDFQFNFTKSLVRGREISQKNLQSYTSLLYTFHRALIDSLNIALMQQLITGSNYLEIPWRYQFKRKRKVQFEHAKLCLERSINMVSNWGQYCLGQIREEDQQQDNPYAEQKCNLVCKEEIFDQSLSSVFAEGHILFQIAELIIQQQTDLAAFDLINFK